MQISSALHWTLLAALVVPPVSAIAQNTEDSKQGSEQSDVDPYFRESTAVTSQIGPQVITRNVLQDREGLFWMATWNGILQYNGSTFTNITNKEGLRRYRAFSLLEDRQGNIWFGTTGAGVYRFDGTTYTNLTMKDGLVDDVVLSIFQDSNGVLWFGGLGLTRYDGTTFTTFTKEDGFTSSDVNSISQGPDGSMWFGSRGALFQYDGTTFVNFTKEHELNLHPNAYIPTLFDHNGNLWFGGENGLHVFDGESVQHVFESPCYTLFKDSQQNIWFSGGSLKGQEQAQGVSVLNRFDPNQGLDNLLVAREQIEIQTAAIFGMTEDKDGNIWFGTGQGIARIKADDTVQYDWVELPVVREMLRSQDPKQRAHAFRMLGNARDKAYLPIANEALQQDLNDDEISMLLQIIARAKGKRWSTIQITGKSDTPIGGDLPTAWASKSENMGEVWIELDFATEVIPEQVRIHETCTPGAVKTIEALDNGTWIPLWNGKATAGDAPRWFEPTLKSTKIRTRTIRIVLDTDRQEGWNEIDAVELIGDGKRQWARTARASSSFAGE